jgi:hypothetical protein
MVHSKGFSLPWKQERCFCRPSRRVNWRPHTSQANSLTPRWRFKCTCNSCCCLPMVELVYLTLFTVLSEAPYTQSARQMPKYYSLVGHVCCIRNIQQYRLTPVEYRQPKFPLATKGRPKLPTRPKLHVWYYQHTPISSLEQNSTLTVPHPLT